MQLKLIHKTDTLHDCFATNLPSFLPITITVVVAVKNSTSKVSVDFQKNLPTFYVHKQYIYKYLNKYKYINWFTCKQRKHLCAA